MAESCQGAAKLLGCRGRPEWCLKRPAHRSRRQTLYSFHPDPLRIGTLAVDPPLILAPMAGITDRVYRRIMAEHGAGMVTTEMISAEGICRNSRATWNLCTVDPLHPAPTAVQLFGARPEAMAEAARRLEQQGAVLIDINAGCPVRKVMRQGAGAILLENPGLLALIVEQVKRAVTLPVTVKIRLGWDEQSVRPVEIARRLAAAGADGLTVHARTGQATLCGCGGLVMDPPGESGSGYPGNRQRRCHESCPGAENAPGNGMRWSHGGTGQYRQSLAVCGHCRALGRATGSRTDLELDGLPRDHSFPCPRAAQIAPDKGDWPAAQNSHLVSVGLSGGVAGAPATDGNERAGKHAGSGRFQSRGVAGKGVPFPAVKVPEDAGLPVATSNGSGDKN